MNIWFPTKDSKLCSHFWKRKSLSFIEIDDNSNKIMCIKEEKLSESFSCHNLDWLINLSLDKVLVGRIIESPRQFFIGK